MRGRAESGAVEPTAAPSPEEQTGKLQRFGRLVGLCAIAAGLYVGLALPGSQMPDSVRVGVPFLLIPFVVLWKVGEPFALGKLDRTLLWSAATYAPLTVWLALYIPSSPQTYAPGARAITGGAFAVLWVVDTFVHVGSVDYFTRRVVHRESEIMWGPGAGFAFGWLAWSLGHIVEWFWLRAALGDVGAAVFLVAAGAMTGLAYMRWKNVVGLMIGHCALNVALAVAA